jgi:amino acid transporter
MTALIWVASVFVYLIVGYGVLRLIYKEFRDEGIKEHGEYDWQKYYANAAFVASVALAIIWPPLAVLAVVIGVPCAIIFGVIYALIVWPLSHLKNHIDRRIKKHEAISSHPHNGTVVGHEHRVKGYLQ